MGREKDRTKGGLSSDGVGDNFEHVDEGYKGKRGKILVGNGIAKRHRRLGDALNSS